MARSHSDKSKERFWRVSVQRITSGNGAEGTGRLAGFAGAHPVPGLAGAPAVPQRRCCFASCCRWDSRSRSGGYRASGWLASHRFGSNSSRRSRGVVGNLVSTSRRYANASIPSSRQVAVMLNSTAARSAIKVIEAGAGGCRLIC